MAKKSSKKAKKSARKTRPQANRICNVVPSRNTQNDWGIEQAITASALAGPAVAAAPVTAPASIDLRASWWGIGNQETTGSCVGWASTDGVARYHFVKANRLAQNAKLSPRFIWMASKETDEFVNRPETMIEGAGTSLKAALDILRKYGAVPETLLPFKIATSMYLGDDDTFFAAAAARRIASYFNLQKNLANWRTWLANKGPCWSSSASMRPGTMPRQPKAT